MSLAEANLIIHFLAILSWMPLAEANLIIHFPTILSWMSLVESILINMPDFIYIEHNIIVVAFIIKILNCMSLKERENYALASPISWPPPIEDPIPVTPPESQRSLWSCFLQAKCYSKSIFIHYTYGTFHACSFSHHNIHIHIKYIFKVGISMCKCSHDSVFINEISVSLTQFLRQWNFGVNDSNFKST